VGGGGGEREGEGGGGGGEVGREEGEKGADEGSLQLDYENCRWPDILYIATLPLHVQ